MTAPTPYVPEDGAIICRRSEVPAEGWEWRGSPSGPWHPPPPFGGAGLVEARPIPPEPVAVMIPRDLALGIVRGGWNTLRLQAAVRAALDAEARPVTAAGSWVLLGDPASGDS